MCLDENDVSRFKVLKKLIIKRKINQIENATVIITLVKINKFECVINNMFFVLTHYCS